jgi:archaellum component FlaC
LGILNYFGEIVRDRCPDESAKIRIEQDGSMVRLVIEGEDGSREIIEKALEEYELVVTGQAAPESIFDDKAKVLELKNELRIAQARIESQRDLIEYQRNDMNELRQLFNRSLISSTAKDINLSISPNINVSTNQSSAISVVCGVSEVLDDIESLIGGGASDPEMTLRLNDLYESVENVDENSTAELVRSSTGMAKLRRFLNDAAETGSEVNTFLEKVSNGIGVAKSLAKKYNSIAQWCGAPQVPEILIK